MRELQVTDQGRRAGLDDGPDDLGLLQNKIFAEIAVGDTQSVQRSLTSADVQLYAMLSGDESVRSDNTRNEALAGQDVVVHGIWASVLIATLIGSHLPGPGSTYLEQNLRFHRPVRVGDTVHASITVVERDEATYRLGLAVEVRNAAGEIVVDGRVDVIAPLERITYKRATLPEVRMRSGDGLERLLTHVSTMGSIRMAVVHPCDALSLSGALDARAAGLIEPVLVAPRAKLEKLAHEAGFNLEGIEIVDVPHSHAAADRAVQMAAAGEVEALMKGSLHSDELIKAIIQGGLRTKRRISHCFLMQTPAYPRPFIITDAAVNIAPDLPTKADIIRNAIELAHTIGVAQPKVAILAAVETVNPGMQATLDAAALCKMADRGQISGGLLDGPLAFDNAVSAAAAHVKGIESLVAGHADVLVVPDLESGNMLAKQLEYLGDASSAGILMGAKVPVVLTSRADSREARIASCALALMLAQRYRVTPP